MFGLIAQLVERSAHNRLVLGSSPSWPTILFMDVISLSDRSKRVLASVLASMCAFTCSLAVKNVPSAPSGVESSSKKTFKRIRGKKKNKSGAKSNGVGKKSLTSSVKKPSKVFGVSGQKKNKRSQ